MARVIIALLVGAAIAGAAVLFLARPRIQGPVAPETPRGEPDERSTLTADKPRADTSLRETPAERPALEGDFPPGTVELRIGDGFDFGERGAVRGAISAPAEGDFDIVCQDIRHGTSLRTPHGATEARLPAILPDALPDFSTRFEWVADASGDLGDRNVSLPGTPDERRSGVGLIRGRNGTVYKVMVMEVHGHPAAWNRRVRLRYAEVPVVDDGGWLRVPGALRGFTLPEEDLEELAAIRERVETLPGKNNASEVDGKFTQIESPPDELVVSRKRRLAWDGPLGSNVELQRGGAIYAPRGVSSEGRITYRGTSGIIVQGEMAGTITANAYGYVYIDGDVTGLVDCQSYSTVVVRGDIRGTLKLRSYVTLILEGTILNRESGLDISGSCWSTFYFARYHSAADLTTLGGDSSVTLHVERSDLPAGKHEGIGGWREVIVDDPVWESIPR